MLNRRTGIRRLALLGLAWVACWGWTTGSAQWRLHAETVRLNRLMEREYGPQSGINTALWTGEDYARNDNSNGITIATFAAERYKDRRDFGLWWGFAVPAAVLSVFAAAVWVARGFGLFRRKSFPEAGDVE